MNKYIKSIILYHTLLLYCCSEYKLNTGSKPGNLYNAQIPKKPTTEVQENRNVDESDTTLEPDTSTHNAQIPKKPTTEVQENRNVDESDTALESDLSTIFSLTADEETKFNTFELALNEIKTIYKNILDYPKQEVRYAQLYSQPDAAPNEYTEKGYKLAKEHLAKARVLYSQYGQDYKRIINEYTNLMKWIKDKPQQKQKLVQAFAPAYDFLETKRQENSPSENINQYISSAITWYGKSHWKKESDIFDVSRNGMYGKNSENCIYKFFKSIMNRSFSFYDANEMTEEKLNESLIDKIVWELTSCGWARINPNHIPILRAWGEDTDDLQCSK
ncbi:Mlp family lipoprotein (plasmid) [Borrelia coriaceae]|uniref:Mlp lipoprotein family protein n=1 Tax=Borrelia coriaceae ATCC 43381 TaxID=1408429 RepID=W5SWU9_9SPIR|nr:Mlp family lipoprotein [Borrelia coriaceae]AHH11679.1 hypothetical protein BCO_0900125 [Borrelia coriaceae ATCC 43381]UPA16889.1 Mlp family lipoprotein [Borrelia coriaceae]